MSEFVPSDELRQMLQDGKNEESALLFAFNSPVQLKVVSHTFDYTPFFKYLLRSSELSPEIIGVVFEKLKTHAIEQKSVYGTTRFVSALKVYWRSLGVTPEESMKMQSEIDREARNVNAGAYALYTEHSDVINKYEKLYRALSENTDALYVQLKIALATAVIEGDVGAVNELKSIMARDAVFIDSFEQDFSRLSSLVETVFPSGSPQSNALYSLKVVIRVSAPLQDTENLTFIYNAVPRYFSENTFKKAKQIYDKEWEDVYVELKSYLQRNRTMSPVLEQVKNLIS